MAEDQLADPLAAMEAYEGAVKDLLDKNVAAKEAFRKDPSDKNRKARDSISAQANLVRDKERKVPTELIAAREAFLADRSPENRAAWKALAVAERERIKVAKESRVPGPVAKGDG